MKHVHEWIENKVARGDSELWGCECGEFSDICHVCSGPSGSSLWICERCLRAEEVVLDDIERFTQQWDERDRRREQSPMAPKLTLSKSVGSDGPAQPEDIEDELLAWHALWAEHHTPTREGVVGDLKRWLRWAVHNPRLSGWETYRDEVRQIRSKIQRVVGLAPEVVPNRCMYCNGRVVQDRCDKRGIPYADGRQDLVRCTRCGVTWDDLTAFQIVVRQGIRDLPMTAPDAMVTFEQAKKIWPTVDRFAWRDWRGRDRLFRGGMERIADIQRLVDRRKSGKPGRQSEKVGT